MDTLCGNEIPKTIYNSTENKMLVVMQTDSTVESKGFSAKFKTVRQKKKILSKNFHKAIGEITLIFSFLIPLDGVWFKFIR